MMRKDRAETLKLALLSVGILAGCTAELFYTPSEMRGIWDLRNTGRLMVVTERSITLYDDTGTTCELDYSQDFAGPRLAEWEVFLSPDGQRMRFREAGSERLVEAARRDSLPERCILRMQGQPPRGAP